MIMQKAKDLRTMGQGEKNKGQDRASSGWEAVIGHPAARPLPPRFGYTKGTKRFCQNQ